jgi:hypothetical protein
MTVSTGPRGSVCSTYVATTGMSPKAIVQAVRLVNPSVS